MVVPEPRTSRGNGRDGDHPNLRPVRVAVLPRRSCISPWPRHRALLYPVSRRDSQINRAEGALAGECHRCVGTGHEGTGVDADEAASPLLVLPRADPHPPMPALRGSSRCPPAERRRPALVPHRAMGSVEARGATAAAAVSAMPGRRSHAARQRNGPRRQARRRRGAVLRPRESSKPL